MGCCCNAHCHRSAYTGCVSPRFNKQLQTLSQTNKRWMKQKMRKKNTHKHTVTEEETHSDLMYDITYINISSLLIWIIFISCDLWLCNLRATRERERENIVSHCSGYFFYSLSSSSTSSSFSVSYASWCRCSIAKGLIRVWGQPCTTITSYEKEYNINANNKHYNTKCAQFGCFQNDTNHTRYKICLSAMIFFGSFVRSFVRSVAFFVLFLKRMGMYSHL